MFAYCLNNPVCFDDPTGEKVEIWPVLFEDHNPGYIHNAVRDHIIACGLFRGELYLPGVGRADIYDPETLEIWEIKHGGSAPSMQMQRTSDAINQVNRYIKGANEKLDQVLRVGHAGAFTGSFVINCGKISYLVTYDTPEPGVVLYYVKQMQKFEYAASLSYVPKTSENMKLAVGGAVCAGVLLYTALSMDSVFPCVAPG